MKAGTLSIEPISVEHPQHRLVGAAVQRAVERRRGAGQRRVRIDVRAADVAHRAGAAVLLVIGVQDEEHVERALEDRVRLVAQLGHLEQHVEEVAGVAEVVVRQHVRPADDVAVGVGGDRRHLGDQPDHLQPARLASKIVLGVRIEGRQRADRAEEHAHRVRVVAEALDELLDVLVQHRVLRDVARPVLELRVASAARRTGSGRRSRGSRCAPPAARSGSRGRGGCPCRRR